MYIYTTVRFRRTVSIFRRFSCSIAVFYQSEIRALVQKYYFEMQNGLNVRNK